MKKSPTDLFWNQRVLDETDDTKVNIADTVQRELELEFVSRNLPSSSNLLEVGCGNGYATQRFRDVVRHVDAFDLSENMIARARQLYGERNNRFFCDNVLTGEDVAPPYDVIICIRVLINLGGLEEQKVAIQNMASWLRHSGRLILVEGFRDGFDELNKLREQAGIEKLNPAEINFYSYVDALMPTVAKDFTRDEEFHTGMFDYLTRVVYPALVGAENATGMSDFHHRIKPLVKVFNPDEFQNLARLRGMVLTRR